MLIPIGIKPELLALTKKLSKGTIRSALQLPIKTRKSCTWHLPILKTGRKAPNRKLKNPIN
jgi:hypothetical protein